MYVTLLIGNTCMSQLYSLKYDFCLAKNCNEKAAIDHAPLSLLTAPCHHHPPHPHPLHCMTDLLSEPPSISLVQQAQKKESCKHRAKCAFFSKALKNNREWVSTAVPLNNLIGSLHRYQFPHLHHSFAFEPAISSAALAALLEQTTPQQSMAAAAPGIVTSSKPLSSFTRLAACHRSFSSSDWPVCTQPVANADAIRRDLFLWSHSARPSNAETLVFQSCSVFATWDERKGPDRSTSRVETRLFFFFLLYWEFQQAPAERPV